MLALVLVGALIAQTTLGAPNRCTEFCDEPVTSGAISSGRNGGYSSYSRYGSHSSWSSGTGSIGSRNGLGSTGGRLENLDENGIASTFGGLDRPGTWEDKKHYVTDDGRGEMNYRAGQTVTNNGFSKFASHSYRYGTHDNHQPKPDSLILSTAEFERELQGIRQRISNFMSSFRLDSGSTINANFLRDFTNNAKLMNSQMNNVCNQVDIGSQMYQQMQSVIDQFNRDVAQRQREIESIIYQSTSSSNVNVNADWVSHPSTQPSPAPIQYPTRPTVSVDTTQQVEQQLNVIHNMVAQFASTFNQADATSQNLNNLDAEISIINRKINDISSQALQYETVRGRFEQLKTYFESCVSSIRARIEEMERRQREQEERRIQREQELRLEAERRAEERRLEQIRIQEENERIQREQFLAQQQQQQQLLLQQQQQQQLQLQQQQQLQLQQQQQQQQQHIQPTQYPHTSGGSVQVSGSIEESYSGSYGAHISSSGDSSTGSNGGYQASSPVYQRPQSVSAPEVDIIATANTLQQDLHRLQNEVNRFNSYSMRLTSSNSASVIAEAESTAASLKNRINNLCDTSNKYSNAEVNNLAEQLKQRLQGFVQNFHNQAASYSSQYNSQYSQNGQFGTSGGYQSSARYGSVQAPKVTNVEYEHSQSTEVEITGRNPSEGRNSYTRLGRSVGENYGPYFDLNQESIDYGQQPQPILDRDFTYGRTDELDSYNPHGYDLRNSEIPERFDDYSQRSSPVELPREYQPVRSGDRRQAVVRHQSHRSHQTHQTEDLTYQPGAADDYYLRQYSQSPSIGSQWEGESDSTQQHVSYGESEDLENMERPRSQKIDTAHNPWDRTLVSDARNREINQYGEENRRQGINRLKPHSAGEYETSNASGRSRIAGSYSKFESSQRTEEMTLEKSGFNDYSDRTENPTSTSQRGQQMAYDSSRLEQQTEEPQSVRPIEVHKKFEYAQKTENLTLEQSGFYYKGSTEKPWVAQVTTVASSGKVGSALEVEDLNLGNTYFNDYSSQSRNKQLNDKPQRIGMPSAVNYDINQQNEKPDIQQSGFGSLYSQNEKLENFDQIDLNQQTAGQINFGAESQVGRQYSSYATNEPGKLNVDSEPNLKPNVQHPVGQYIDNLSQQREESFLTDELSNGQLNINNHGNQILTTTRYSHDLLPTTRPTVKPAPKPIPRYTRPWQVSQVNNLPKKLETEEKQVERDNTKIEESVNLQSHDKQSESLRGDLPGVSETSPVPVTTEKLDINQQENSEYDSRQQFEQVNINANSQPDDLQKSRNDWVHNNDRNSQSGQTYFSQQSIQHNYEHSQQSIYYSQQNSGRDINSSNYQPMYTQNSNNQQQESLPHKLESDQLAINKQEDVRQQVQIASFAEQTNQDTNQREEDEFAERVIPLEETKTIGDLSVAETTTAPPSFWKRVGHKLSNSFDKAKEKARNIFG